MDQLSAILPSALDEYKIKETAAARDPNTLGQQQFFELMVTQLKNQDPFKPMESGDFLGQIAQFSTVSGIGELQKSFATLAGSLQSSQALQASTMVGREVVVPRADFPLTPGTNAHLAAALPATSPGVRVSIFDAAGQLVRQATLGAHAAGTVSYVWDGRTDNGASAPAGRYQARFEANLGGQEQALESTVRARVDSVTLTRDGAAPTLNLAGYGAVAMSDVREIL